MKKAKFLGIKNILELDLEYLTKLSVNIDIDKTSINLENEYIRGIKEKLLLKNLRETIFARQSTSLQHKFKPCPPTGCNL